ncbi:hypothetical protein M378DRAFT_28587 [Amanita muscaria Koide BX008]|uniref:Uncharacterized protein n=1 Tax=Amanita muscaria (strain Koide BX008) TaxID=946122 RepID=A0A0C2WF93_AMAMK|nr:hypothetical protein M378DRAFT_28587 [Amanita muscaria Koide BX008]
MHGNPPNLRQPDHEYATCIVRLQEPWTNGSGRTLVLGILFVWRAMTLYQRM